MLTDGISTSSLSNFMKLLFNFLWSRIGKNNKFHLANWELICLPKSWGRWGLRNLSWFGHALKLRVLWRGLFDEGLWGYILWDKYMGSLLVIQWIKKGYPSISQASNI